MPRSVVIIRKAFDWLLIKPKKAAVWTMILFMSYSLYGSFYTVKTGYTSAVRRFGKLVFNNVQPGLHIRIPWGVDQPTIYRTGQIYRLNLTKRNGGFLTALTGDENITETQLVIQYRITNLGDYLFRSDYPESIVKNLVRTVFIDLIATRSVDWVLAAGKSKLQKMVFEVSQEIIKDYGIGVSLVSVNLTSVDPPPEALAAFLDVNDAKAERLEMIYNANTRRDRTIAIALGEASRIVDLAKASAKTRVKQAEKSSDKFRMLLAEKVESPEQTLITKYRKMARRIVSRARIVVLTPDQETKLGVNLLERGVFPPSDMLRGTYAGKPPPVSGKKEPSKEKMVGVASPSPSKAKQLAIGKAVHDYGGTTDRRPGAGMHKSEREPHHIESSPSSARGYQAHGLAPNTKMKTKGKGGEGEMGRMPMQGDKGNVQKEHSR